MYQQHDFCRSSLAVHTAYQYAHTAAIYSFFEKQIHLNKGTQKLVCSCWMIFKVDLVWCCLASVLSISPPPESNLTANLSGRSKPHWLQHSCFSVANTLFFFFPLQPCFMSWPALYTDTHIQPTQCLLLLRGRIMPSGLLFWTFQTPNLQNGCKCHIQSTKNRCISQV